MKKTIASILGISLICCGFTACGDKDTNSEAAKNNSATDNWNTTNNTDTFDDRNGVEKIITGAENAVDDLVSDGERIIDDAGSVLDDSNNNSLNNN